ncbi:MAG: 3-methyl-2-oxobutanoate hydroxymethyltransferase [Acidobacteriota bacterium]
MAATMRRVRVPQLSAMKRKGEKIVMLTAYDATFARLFECAGVDVMLVGDSLGMVVEGQETTLPVTMEAILHHTRAVVRGTQRALVVADMPFGSYQTGVDDALRNAVRLVKDGGADAVKLEGGASAEEAVRRMTASGIPVMGHVGLTPQSVKLLGGFRAQGKTDEEKDRIFDDARRLEDAGAFAVVLESIPNELSARITGALAVPTIGIGAGESCDGQVLVCYDLLGLTQEVPPFVKQYARLGELAVEAVKAYAAEVRG